MSKVSTYLCGSKVSGDFTYAVVQLPQQCSTTASLLAPLLPPASIAEHECLSLAQLCQMYELLEVSLGLEILNKICCYPSFMSIGLVVEIDHMTLRVELSWVRYEGLDRVDVWKSCNL